GATRVMELVVRGARSERDARLAAHAIATSPLVKTALHGGDPNWGRILAAVGRSGARFSAKRVSLAAGPVTLVRDGPPAPYREPGRSAGETGRRHGSADCQRAADAGSGGDVARRSGLEKRSLHVLQRNIR